MLAEDLRLPKRSPVSRATPELLSESYSPLQRSANGCGPDTQVSWQKGQNFISSVIFLTLRGCCVDERLLVLQPGIRAVPLRWESQLQDTGPQETSQLYIIPNGENLPETSISKPRPSFTQQPASYSAGHPMPNN